MKSMLINFLACWTLALLSFIVAVYVLDPYECGQYSDMQFDKCIELYESYTHDTMGIFIMIGVGFSVIIMVIEVRSLRGDEK